MAANETQYSVCSATFGDLPSLASVFRAAFNDNPRTLSYWIFPHDDQQANYSYRLADLRHRFTIDDDCRYYKLIDVRINQVIGLSVWQVPSSSRSSDEKAKKKADDEKFETTQVFPRGTNRQLLSDFTLETTKMRAKYVDSTKDYVLKILAVSPEYQGRGCASMLLEAALEQVDAAGAKSVLEATPQAHTLYSKFGWRDVDTIVSDLANYDCRAQHKQVTTVMVRDAQGPLGSPT